MIGFTVSILRRHRGTPTSTCKARKAHLASNNEWIALLWHGQEDCSPKVAERALIMPEPVQVRVKDRSRRRVDQLTSGTWDWSRCMGTSLARKSTKRQQPRAVPHDGAIVNVDDVRARVGLAGERCCLATRRVNQEVTQHSATLLPALRIFAYFLLVAATAPPAHERTVAR